MREIFNSTKGMDDQGFSLEGLTQNYATDRVLKLLYFMVYVKSKFTIFISDSYMINLVKTKKISLNGNK